ncbi:hypothetical protein BDC45DRAFT_519863 [Circinella umbellata]|nr:hypothetical protein BDC45DRAFT_519863 [Circinella umbellata]
MTIYIYIFMYCSFRILTRSLYTLQYQSIIYHNYNSVYVLSITCSILFVYNHVFVLNTHS